MALTPLDIEKLDLRLGFRGYVREDVERFRYDVLRSVEDYLARIAALQARVGELERDLQQYRANEDLLKSSVVLAQKTSDELITAARQRADLIIREAEAEGETIRRRLADIRNEREQFEYAFHGLLSGFLHRLEQGNPELRPAPQIQPAALASRSETRTDHDSVSYTNRLVDGAVTASDVDMIGQPTQDTASSRDAGFTVLPSQAAASPAQQVFAPAMPSRGAGAAAVTGDRDADIDSFSAALDSAPVKPGPPRISAREHGGSPLETREASPPAAPDTAAQPDPGLEGEEQAPVVSATLAAGAAPAVEPAPSAGAPPRSVFAWPPTPKPVVPAEADADKAEIETEDPGADLERAD